MVASSPPAPPREAATVIVLRPGPQGLPEILMVRRSAQSPFMPSTFVFPGGRVDPADGPAGTAEAFERAARRECHEETGLALDGLALCWFDTWLTPSAEPRRYFARFYYALLQAGQGANVRADGRETHDERWATADDLITEWERARLDLPPPTLATLLRLRGLEPGAIADLARSDPAPPILPKWIAHNDDSWVVMPHDPEYSRLPGEGHPAPDRVQKMPFRFRRQNERWIPWHG